MALSDSPRRKDVSSGRSRAVSAKKRYYSDSQKLEAVQTYLMLGNMVMVSAVLKINIATLKVWKASEWWKDLERDLRTQEDLQISQRLQKIVNKSLDVVEDRLENGDFVYDQKTGNLRRKPVGLKDAHKVIMDMQERRDNLIDKHISNESVTTDRIEQTLKTLADEFAKIANKVNEPAKIEVTDVIFGQETEDNAKDE